MQTTAPSMIPPGRRSGPVTVAYGFLSFGEGGAQRLALETWRHLDPARYRPTLLCVGRPGALVGAAAAAGVRTVALGRLGRRLDFGAVPAIARWLRAEGAEVVHVPLYSRASPYLRVAARLAGVPLTVAHEHCRDRPPSRARRLVDRLLVPGTRFVAVSAAHRDALVRTGVPAAAVRVIANGVDVGRFAPGDREEARAALGLPAGAPIVLVPARLVARKGHADLLAAWPAVRAAVPGAIVLCAGDGWLREVLPALAAAAGLGEAVRFLGHRDDLPVLLAAADVVALPSRGEGLPLAVLEALAAGRPVVATDVGGNREAVEDGRTGRLVAPGDPGALAVAIAELLADGEARRRIGEQGRRVALERYRSEDVARQLEDAYDAWLAALGVSRWGAARPAAAVPS